MKRSRVLGPSIALALAAMALAPQALAEAERGAALAASCFTCHSIDATGNMPNLVGYPRDLMVSQMQAFTDGSRPATIMNRLSKGYSEADIELIADYIATLQ
ncbi:MAG TPA: c-type cytochrome [Thioalkalivibrio sp.]|nr:c-type cytochrome [Thioalkalivibrio sp.]